MRASVALDFFCLTLLFRVCTEIDGDAKEGSIEAAEVETTVVDDDVLSIVVDEAHPAVTVGRGTRGLAMEFSTTAEVKVGNGTAGIKADEDDIGVGGNCGGGIG